MAAGLPFEQFVDLFVRKRVDIDFFRRRRFSGEGR